VFVGKAQCAVCHSGFNFSDNGFHNIGVKNLTEKEDNGRFTIVPINSMKGAFKTVKSDYKHTSQDHRSREDDDVNKASPVGRTGPIKRKS
jgi:cytochrome c peroxidase